ncbi:chemotaxis response regulator CheY [Marinobacter nanhaiticus D15-8W]|uniref:Response regulator n=1 Tax=Marinobacter nanhaiticus D15-8W TaxID=626887 RepID=N6X231_9GAMM|nr:response regulator [Marinobacter nanhaiticus]ENO15118.1 response regulator [Marinobacter nanhaiticus D15-8W]BES69183.1 chemotaxis response regulator CheY [Marinobacter nanhaiticus D15-8W]
MENLRVLVVEDEPTMRELLKDMLHQAGATMVVECEDAASAQERFRQEDFHIVMLDLGLPDMDGHDLMKAFKQVNDKQHIVLVTADDSIDSIQRAISAGANGYVVKPYSKEKIQDVVNNYVMVHGEEADVLRGFSRHH